MSLRKLIRLSSVIEGLSLEVKFRGIALSELVFSFVSLGMILFTFLKFIHSTKVDLNDLVLSSSIIGSYMAISPIRISLQEHAELLLSHPVRREDLIKAFLLSYLKYVFAFTLLYSVPISFALGTPLGLKSLVYFMDTLEVGLLALNIIVSKLVKGDPPSFLDVVLDMFFLYYLLPELIKLLSYWKGWLWIALPASAFYPRPQAGRETSYTNHIGRD